MLDAYAQEHFARAAQEMQFTAVAMRDPHVLMRPTLTVDGIKWCALYGENLQDGCAGFGDTPAAAMADFDKNWMGQKLSTATKEQK